ncbi:MAG TPA: tyrosine-type recombinase/integrase [Clostridia bacterium]|nr:tyrosine-type recombinase/integrase [Clostridia bacterium]
MKLPNGYGSVYKAKGNRRKPWVARKTIGWSDGGKQDRYIIGYFETKAKAMAALAEYNKNPMGTRGDITLEGLYAEWSRTRYPKLSKSTRDGYSAAWKHLSELMDERLRDIKTSHIQAIINRMNEDGMSRSSCHKVKVLAGLLYKYALADDIVDRNYAEMVELPAEKKKEQEIFTDLEIKKLEDAVGKVEWVDVILIFIYTGMRISELFELTKFNVDIKNMVITGGVKTDAGRDRIIPIHPKIQGHIKKWYAVPGEYLISNTIGTMMNVDNFRHRKYYPTLEKVGVRKLSPHKARHTFASMLNKAGANKVYIQKLIGHANYAITANTYTHSDVEELRKAIEMI